MKDRTLACLVLAVAAFGLPWQRCASDCHDRLLPAVADHDCHDEPCQQHEDEGDHERIEFLSVPVGTPPALVAVPMPVDNVQAAAPLAEQAPIELPPSAHPPDGRPPTATTVLLV